jgi:hypothetical protein
MGLEDIRITRGKLDGIKLWARMRRCSWLFLLAELGLKCTRMIKLCIQS